MATTQRGPLHVIAEARRARELAATAFWMMRREIQSAERRLAALRLREKALLEKLEK